jgi:hypothetical protein
MGSANSTLFPSSFSFLISNCAVVYCSNSCFHGIRPDISTSIVFPFSRLLSSLLSDGLYPLCWLISILFSSVLCFVCVIWWEGSRVVCVYIREGSRSRSKKEKERLFTQSVSVVECVLSVCWSESEREQSCEIPHMLLVVCMMPLQSPEGKGGGGGEGRRRRRRHKHTFIQMESLSYFFVCLRHTSPHSYRWKKKKKKVEYRREE